MSEHDEVGKTDDDAAALAEADAVIADLPKFDTVPPVPGDRLVDVEAAALGESIDSLKFGELDSALVTAQSERDAAFAKLGEHATALADADAKAQAFRDVLHHIYVGLRDCNRYLAEQVERQMAAKGLTF